MTQEHECPPTCQIAADLAVKKVFALIGVDVDEPESVAEFCEDLRFGRRMRKATEYGLLTAVGAVVVSVCTLVTAGLVAMFRGSQG